MIRTYFLFFLILFYSCSDYLEIVPDYKFPSELATSNLDSLQSITNGIFNQIQSGNIYGGGIISNSELLSDNWNSSPISSFSLNQLRTRQMNSYNGEALGLWSDAYRAINMCNIVLHHLSEHEEQDINKANIIRGECLFVRAICHFELVRMFAMPYNYTSGNNHLGIPIRLTKGSATDEQNNPRNQVNEVYLQIIEDLEESINFLPSNKVSRVSKWASIGFLAKVYFQMNDYQNSLNKCNEIIESGLFSLNNSVNEIYSLSGFNFSDETIFQIINIPQDNSNGVITGRLKSTSVNYFSPFDSLVNFYNDDRKNLLYTFFGVPYLRKYSNTSMNITIIRLAEILLTRAECKVHLNYSFEDVREDYNLIRQRANYSIDNSSVTNEQLLTSIRRERCYELGFEGDRLHEIRRLQETFRTSVGNFEWDDPRLVYPIPQQEMDNNTNMIQNEGY